MILLRLVAAQVNLDFAALRQRNGRCDLADVTSNADAQPQHQHADVDARPEGPSASGAGAGAAAGGDDDRLIAQSIYQHRGKAVTYPEWRDMHESIIVQYPPEIRLELRRSRAKFWKANERAEDFEKPPTSGGQHD